MLLTPQPASSGRPRAGARRSARPGRRPRRHDDHRSAGRVRCRRRHASRPCRRDGSPRPSRRRRRSGHISTARPTGSRCWRGFQALRRSASSASLSSTSIVPAIGVDRDHVAVRSSAIGPPTAASGPTWPMQKPRVRAGEAAVGDQRHLLAHALAVERRRGRQHLAHAGPAARPLVADDDDLALLVVGAARPRRRRPPRSRSTRAGPRELQVLHAGDLHDRALRREVALQADHAAGRRRSAFAGRADHVLVRSGTRRRFRFSAMVLPVTVMQSPCR